MRMTMINAAVLLCWLVLPAEAQPPVTSPEQMAATRELFYLHAHGGHRSPALMPYGAFSNGAELTCTDGASSGDRTIHYPLNVPSHLFLERVQVWGHDDGLENRLRVRILSVCHTGPQSPPVQMVIASADSAEGQFGPSYFDLPVFRFGSQQDCFMTIEVRMAVSGRACVGNSRSVMRVRAQAFDPSHIFRDGFVPRVLPSRMADSSGASR